MSSTEIRVEKETLAALATRFGRQAEEAGQMHQVVLRAYDQLRGGGWKGVGADAFFVEMDEIVLPAVGRLTEALGQAGQTTKQVNELMQSAESEAVSCFKGETETSPVPAPGSTGMSSADNLTGVPDDWLSDVSEASTDTETEPQISSEQSPSAVADASEGEGLAEEAGQPSESGDSSGGGGTPSGSGGGGEPQSQPEPTDPSQAVGPTGARDDVEQAAQFRYQPTSGVSLAGETEQPAGGPTNPQAITPEAPQAKSEEEGGLGAALGVVTAVPAVTLAGKAIKDKLEKKGQKK